MSITSYAYNAVWILTSSTRKNFMAELIWKPVPGAILKQYIATLKWETANGFTSARLVANVWHTGLHWRGGYFPTAHGRIKRPKYAYKTLAGIRRHMEKTLWVLIISGGFYHG